MRELLAIAVCVLIGFGCREALQIWKDFDRVEKESALAEERAQARAEENRKLYGVTFAPVR